MDNTIPKACDNREDSAANTRANTNNMRKILAGHVGKDHNHLLVSVPPHLSASKLVQYLKGSLSHKLQMEYKELNKQYWGRHLWARGYFVASSGNVTEGSDRLR